MSSFNLKSITTEETFIFKAYKVLNNIFLGFYEIDLYTSTW